MKKKIKCIINLNDQPIPLFFIILLFIMILCLPSRVFPKSGQQEQEPKGKSNSFNTNSSTQGKKLPQVNVGATPSQNMSAI